MMKKIIVFLIMLNFSCSSNKKGIENDFETEIVYFQKWIAGVQGGGSGIEFHVVFKKPLKEDFVLEKVNFQSYEGVFKKISDLEYVANLTTFQNDFILEDNPKNEYGNKLSLKKELNSNNALLYFFIKSKGKYLAREIENVKEKPTLAYPSMERPKN